MSHISTAQRSRVSTLATRYQRRRLLLYHGILAAIFLVCAVPFAFGHLYLSLAAMFVVGGAIRIPLFSQDATSELVTDLDPETVETAFLDPYTPIAWLQWGAGDDVETTVTGGESRLRSGLSKSSTAWDTLETSEGILVRIIVDENTGQDYLVSVSDDGAQTRVTIQNEPLGRTSILRKSMQRHARQYHRKIWNELGYRYPSEA